MLTLEQNDDLGSAQARHPDGEQRRPSRDKTRAARRGTQRQPRFNGWRTSDEEEVERRRWRGRTDVAAVEALEPDQPFFGTFRVQSASGAEYSVEIRSLSALTNSCDCLDYRANGLGTCKHIEGTLVAIRRGRARQFDHAARGDSPRVELYLDRRGAAEPRLSWPPTAAADRELRGILAPLLGDDGDSRPLPIGAVAAVKRALAGAPARLRAQIRVSRHLDHWLEDQRRRDGRAADKNRFLAAVADGRESLQPLRLPLLPYQQDGMLHLAFGERALLADDMGLGKTAQAIGASVLLKGLRGIGRVLVVCPASLKGEWRDQIARFTDLETLIVAGPRAARLRDYRKSAFFYLTNYEQIIADGPEINRILVPDLVILDEAQRIKNWQTKTARAVKGLDSRYAFVLTGTPIENRIDEIYSIVQYLDPELLGPLFKFNRAFYEFDERGRPQDYRNLDELHRRLKPIMLRRRKSDIAEQLPGRSVTNYFVAMDGEQRVRYQDYEGRAARLLHVARKRPLTKAEFDRLQMWLACMRMVCDTPYILDSDCRVCPKLEELERVLADLLAEPERKIIVFSEWVRMLELVRDLALGLGIEFAWHTGSVPQDRRRSEIRRFKTDPGCRLFLSSDSGSLGLNLQAASVVVNLDLPWNPAKLEQRIARAWRKYQTRPVDVINLITEDSIESRMLGLLTLKQDLADGVLDGRGDLKALRMPSGRAAFVARLEAAMGLAPDQADATTASRRATPSEQVRDHLLNRQPDSLLLVEARETGAGAETVVAVLDADRQTCADEAARLREGIDSDRAGTPGVEIIDVASYREVRRLIAAGVLSFAGAPGRELYRAAGFLTDAEQLAERRISEARILFGEADRQLRMASLLAGGGFAAESRAPLAEAAIGAVRSVTVLMEPIDSGAPESPGEAAKRLAASGLLPEDAVATLSVLADANGHQDAPDSIPSVARLVAAAEGLIMNTAAPAGSGAA
ncbi:MAG: DEAD/DEAH box helicase [Alphaproteobacteria bacterium]|nr:DEAD/DEAH box helicase [Alphaproteobacteria bacterium]